MDQSKSNDNEFVPKRKITLETVVGLFSIVGLLAAAWLSIGLGGLDLNSSNEYYLTAEFDDVSGLKRGASVEIAGVPIGEVLSIELQDSTAVLKLKIDNKIQLQDDDIAMIRTKGIIGDRYVKISRGASGNYLPADSRITETESVVDFEDIVGKIVHSLTSKDEDTEETTKE